MTRHLTHVAALVFVLASCDKDKSVGDAIPATPAPPATTVSNAYPEALDARGEVDGLLWKHDFDGANSIGVVRCGDHAYTATASGRVLRWDPEFGSVQGVVPDLADVASIHAVKDGVLFGTSGGRLISGTCDLSELVRSHDLDVAVHFAEIDPRSQTRALTLTETRGKKRKAVGSLVDLRTGKSVQDPFHVDAYDDAHLVGFVDYKAELWMALVRPSGSQLWYLERFDEDQPTVAGLPPRSQIEGLTHVRREVWAYGTTDNGSNGFLARVDTGRATIKWDGQKAWFGSQPGGDVPLTKPIHYVVHGLDHVWVFTADSAYRADAELRRWYRVPASDPDGDLFSKTGGHVVGPKRIVLATHRGVVRVDRDGWSLRTIPAPEVQINESALPTTAKFGGDSWTVDDEGLQRSGGKVPKGTSKTRFVATDAEGRLWLLGDERIHLLERGASKPRSWKVDQTGYHPSRVRGLVATSKDAIGLAFEDGSGFHFRLPTE